MRIIAGRHRGRRLETPEGRAIRPTSDRAREALFSMLEHRLAGGIAGKRVADIFAGTGALGLEALSRGAAHVTFVENNPESLALLGRNIRTLGLDGASEILRQDARKLRDAAAPCDLILMDPPYGKGLAAPALQRLLEKNWIGAGTLAVVETDAREELATPGGLTVREDRKVGKTRFRFLTPPE